jgi:hypothetical protein
MQGGVILLACALPLAAPLRAQPAAPSTVATPVDHTTQDFVEKAINLFAGPVRLETTAVVPSSGVSLGAAAESDQSHVRMIASGKASVRQFWSADVMMVSHPTPNSFASLYGSARHMPELPFYGTGPNTHSNNKTVFDATDQTLGGWGWRRFKALAFSGRLETTWLTSGKSAANLETMRARFSPPELIGLGSSLRYLHAAGTMDVNYSTPLESPTEGGWYRLAAHRFSGLSGSAMAFTRVDIDLRQYLSLPGGIVLAAQGRALLSPAGDRNRTPFVLLPYLGGDSSLEGYADYRFRDSNSVLIRVQGRRSIFNAVPIWKHTSAGPVYLIAFADAGTVGPGPSALRLTDLKTDAGVGVSVWLGSHALLRVDFAVSRREGLQFNPFASTF